MAFFDAVTTPVIRLSGGASNADPANSIGGVISAVELYNLEGFALNGAATDIPGITPVGFFDSKPDTTNYLITFVAPDLIRAYPNGEALGTDSYTMIEGSGRYCIRSKSDDGFFVFDVDFDLLPASNDTSSYTTDRSYAVNKLFPDVTADQALSGADQYRCLYLENTQSVGMSLRVYLEFNALAGETFEVGARYSISGNTEELLANEFIAPANVSFSGYDSESNALDLFINSNASIGLWFKRSVPSFNSANAVSDVDLIVVRQ